MSERPKAVTVIGWYWRVGGVVGMVLSIPLAIVGADLWGEYYPNWYSALPSSILGLIGFLASLLCLLCGNGILKGKEWARTLALVLCFVSTLAAVVFRDRPLYWFNLMGNLAFIAVIWFFLFRQETTVFFKGDGGLRDG